MKPYLYTLVLAAALTGCSVDNEPVSLDPSAVAPLGISTALVSGVESPATRGTLTTGSIGVFLENAPGSTGYTSKPNVSYSVKGGTWDATTAGQALLLGGEDANVCAYYPYNVAIGDKKAIAMTTQNYDETKVFQYATDRRVNVREAMRSTVFAMTHAYSQLELIFVRDANYPTVCQVTTLAVNHPDMTKTGTLNITTGAYTIVKANYSVTTGLPFTLTTTGATKTFNLLVVPQVAQMGSDLSLALTVDGQSMSTTIVKTSLPQFQPGKKYTVNVSIQGVGIKPTSVTTTDWVATPVNGGSGYVPTPGGDPQ